MTCRDDSLGLAQSIWTAGVGGFAGCAMYMIVCRNPSESEYAFSCMGWATLFGLLGRGIDQKLIRSVLGGLIGAIQKMRISDADDSGKKTED